MPFHFDRERGRRAQRHSPSCQAPRGTEDRAEYQPHRLLVLVLNLAEPAEDEDTVDGGDDRLRTDGLRRPAFSLWCTGCGAGPERLPPGAATVVAADAEAGRAGRSPRGEAMGGACARGRGSSWLHAP